MQFIKSLSEIGRDDLGLVGGKAASLGDLMGAGFSVPLGFCVTTEAYRAFVAANHLEEEINRQCAAADPSQPDTLESAARAIG